MQEIGIYVHIPFCLRKCNYCDHKSLAITNTNLHTFSKAIIKEINLNKNFLSKKTASTIYFGGGTPSLIPAKIIESILRVIKQNIKLSNQIEISIECNPETINKKKLRRYLNLGINRLSFGLQSTENKMIRLLNRNYSFEQFKKILKDSKKIGFKNIGIDLIFSLPGQNLKQWKETLEKTVALEPTHISCYSLDICPKTKFFDQKIEIDEKLDRKMYRFACHFLQKNKYFQYEISNFAKKGFECKHNLNFWQFQEYIGFGPSAHSFYDGVRIENYSNLNIYNQFIINSKIPAKLKEKINLENQIKEFLILNFRLNKGLIFKNFSSKFGIDFCKLFHKQLKKLKRTKLIKIKKTKIITTKKGKDFLNKILYEFI